MFLLGSELRKWYGHLWNTSQVLPLFTGSQERVVDSAESVARGFFGPTWQEQSRLVVLSESEDQGFNSLTPDEGCPNFNYTFNGDYSSNFAAQALASTLKQFQNDLPGVKAEATDIINLMSLCYYDLNVVGESPWCEYFGANDWVAFEYARDLNYYYSTGPGNPLSLAVGSVVANASLSLLKQSQTSDNNNNQSLFMNFAHDSNLFEYLTAFGIAIPSDLQLRWDQLDKTHPISQLTPMGARISLEKLTCGGDNGDSGNQSDNDDDNGTFVRFVINDAVYPYPNCTTGPGFSCPLKEYIAIQEARYVNPIVPCGVEKTSQAPTDLTFYWDWQANPDKYNMSFVST